MLPTQKLLSAAKPLMGFLNFSTFFIFRIKSDGIHLSRSMTVLAFVLLLIIVIFKLWIMAQFSFFKFFEALFKLTDIVFFTFVTISYLNYVIHGKSIVKTWNSMTKYADFVTDDSCYRKAFRMTCLQVLIVHSTLSLHIATLCLSGVKKRIFQRILHMVVNHFLLSHFCGTIILFANCLHFGWKILSLVNEDLRILRRIERYKNSSPVSGTAFVKREEITELRSTLKMMQNEDLFSLIDIYEEICELCLDLNELLGVSITVAWLYNFLAIVLYCFLMTVVGSPSIPLFSFWIFYHLTLNWTLMYCCERFTKEAMKTGLLLNSLTTQNSSKVLKESVQRFSLNLLHRKVKFTACNLFNLDFKFFYSAFSSVITYFVIFVQFYRQ